MLDSDLARLYEVPTKVLTKRSNEMLNASLRDSLFSLRVRILQT
jgi:hypothetical protein